MPDDTEITTSGSFPRRVALRLYVAPATEDQRNTMRPALRTVACFLIGGPGFDFDSSFVTPVMKDEIGGLARLLGSHPDSPIAIFGHADPVGQDDSNKILSGRRAKSIYGLLTRDVDMWEQLFTSSQSVVGDHWSRRQILTILRCLTSPRSLDSYFDGPADVGRTPRSDSAIRAFQQDHSLPTDGDPGTATRRAMFLLYMNFLCSNPRDGSALLLRSDQFLARGADPARKGDVQGCGEFNPAVVPSLREAGASSRVQRNVDSAENRRVVIYLFEPGTRIDPAKWPCPTVEEGDAGCRARFWSDGENRRKPTATQRRFDQTADTFACRFYHRLADNSPCERPTTSPITVDLRFDVPEQRPDVVESFQLASEEGDYDRTLSRSAAIAETKTQITLRYHRVLPGKTYSLFRIWGEDERIAIFTKVPIGLITSFGVEVSPTPPGPPVPSPIVDPRAPPTSDDPLVQENPLDHHDDPTWYQEDPLRGPIV